MRKRPASERASGSSKGWTELPKLAVSISASTLATTSSTSPCGRRLSGDDRRGHAGGACVRVRRRPLVLHAEQRRQDLARLGRRRVGAEATVLGGHDHHVAERRVRRERDVPGLVFAAEPFLRGAGLARDRNREALEDRRGRTTGGAGSSAQSVDDRLAVARVE